MKYKKSLLALILLACILFTVSSVAASNANDTAIASANTIENDEPALSLENTELGDDALAIKKSDENALSMKDTASDKEILSASSGKTVKTTATKQSVSIGAKKMSATYKVKKYFTAKVVNTKTKKPLKGIPVNMAIYTGKTAKVVTLKSNAKGIIAYPTSKLSVGNHKVVLKVKKNNYYTGKAVTTAIKINKATKGKIKTKIQLSNIYFGTDVKQEFLRNEVGSNGWAYPVYGYVTYPEISFKAVLKAPNGKNIAGKYKLIIRIAPWNDGTGHFDATFDGKFGQYQTFTGPYSLDDYYKYIQFEVQYKGNSKFSASKYVSSWKYAE